MALYGGFKYNEQRYGTGILEQDIGSDWILAAYHDDGSLIAKPIRVVRKGSLDDTLVLREGYIGIKTATPASAAAPGTAGDICWDVNYIYVCVAANTWKRSSLATW